MEKLQRMTTIKKCCAQVIYICLGLFTIEPLTIHNSPAHTQENYMLRCIELAGRAIGNVAPNPMVGAVLVYKDRIIGEGYHEYYGGPHAEVNCINSVKHVDHDLIPDAVMHVSLEPCSHFGKTPPCADFIIAKKIKKVIIGCRDSFVEVNGKGIEKLKAAGVEVIENVLEEECKQLNKRFFTFHTQHRPYIVLKWAQTQNGKIAPAFTKLSSEGNNSTIVERLLISNEYTNRVVHKWRSEESSILVGTTTALLDDPELTNRFWPGIQPLRLVLDMDLKLPSALKLFSDKKSYTIVFNSKQHELDNFSLYSEKARVGFYQITEDVSAVQQILHGLYQLKIQSVLVEGGSKLLQSFIDEGVWDEARVITNSELHIAKGLAAPSLSNHELIAEDLIISDQIHYFANIHYKRQEGVL
jgi:diaminohydroxyphosphoribosylaminopyrimidine deaminase/5-amino-6-(5-phosphoribosylamino)uracil reductase